jgi:glyoxylase-like metal-dependent hydrolase (beta-lactamase superfamily II)
LPWSSKPDIGPVTSKSLAGSCSGREGLLPASGSYAGASRHVFSVLLLSVLLFATALLDSSAALARQTPANPVHFQELADGVFVALQGDARRFNESAATVIIGSRGVAVVDTQADPQAVRATLDEIRRRTELPVRWVINTHWHADHTQGNVLYHQAFGDDVTFVAHETVAADITERAAPDLTARVERVAAQLPAAERALAEGVDEQGAVLDEVAKLRFAQQVERARSWLERNRDARWLPPTLSYSERMTLDLGDRRLELRHHRAHTRGDTVVYLPEERILITGDLLDDLPYLGHGYLQSWIETLNALETMDVALYVPGHGTPYHDDGQLDVVRSYLQALIGAVAAEIAEGRDLAALRERIDLSTHRNALVGSDPVATDFFDATLGEAIERAYNELEGTVDSID